MMENQPTMIGDEDVHDVLGLLQFAARRQVDLVLNSPTGRERAKGVLSTVKEELLRSADGSGIQEKLKQHIRVNASRVWGDQPFRLSHIDLRSLGIKVAMFRRSRLRGEEWRDQANVWLETAVLDSSQWWLLFRQEQATLPTSESGGDPIVLRWDGNGFDLELQDFSRRLQSGTTRWLWIVTENLKDFPDRARDALWESAFGRLRDPALSSVKVVRASSDQALADLDACLQHDIWEWRHLPICLLAA